MQKLCGKKGRWIQQVVATPCTISPIWRVLFMARLGRPGLSATQKAELWRRWKKGESLSDIGRALGLMGEPACDVFELIAAKHGPQSELSGQHNTEYEARVHLEVGEQAEHGEDIGPELVPLVDEEHRS